MLAYHIWAMFQSTAGGGQSTIRRGKKLRQKENIPPDKITQKTSPVDKNTSNVNCDLNFMKNNKVDKNNIDRNHTTSDSKKIFSPILCVPHANVDKFSPNVLGTINSTTKVAGRAMENQKIEFQKQKTLKENMNISTSKEYKEIMNMSNLHNYDDEKGS